MTFPKAAFRSFGVTLVLVLAAAVVPSSNPAVAASGRPSVSIAGFALGSSSIPSLAKQKAVRFISNNRNYKTATCIGYADKSGSAAVNQRLAVARANAVCALIKNKGGLTKTKAVGRWNKLDSGATFRRVDIVLSKPKGGSGGGGGTPACEDIDPWPDFWSQDWILWAEQTQYFGEDWLVGNYVPGDWGVVVRQRDDPNSPTWPSELYGACVVESDVVLEYTPDSGTTWNVFDNTYLQSIKPGGSTETLEYNAFNLDPARYPNSYFNNSRYHWTVMTEFQTWDYYSYLTDKVPVWIDVNYDAIVPAGSNNVVVQYTSSEGGSYDAYVTPGTPLLLWVRNGSSINIIAPEDANVDYLFEHTESALVTTDNVNTGPMLPFTGWTVNDGRLWISSVSAEAVFNITSYDVGG